MLPPAAPGEVAPTSYSDLPAPPGRPQGGPGATGLVNRKQVTRAEARRVELPIEMAPSRRAARCKRKIMTHARLMAQEVQQGGKRGRWLMVTTTYAPGVEWHAGHVTRLVKCARDWFARQRESMHYEWVLELTQKGVPHYHLIIWCPNRLLLPSPDRRGWWPHGSTKTEKARNPVGYLAKYASKGTANCYSPVTFELLRVPRGARICGAGGLAALGRAELRWWMTPLWFRDAVPEVCDVRRVNGGYVVRLTGEFIASPWRFIGWTAGMGALIFEWVG